MLLEFSIKAKDLFLGFKWMWLQYLQTNKFCRIVEQYSQECIFYGADKSLYFCQFFREFWISDQKIHSLAYDVIVLKNARKSSHNFVLCIFFSIKKSSLIDPLLHFFTRRNLLNSQGIYRIYHKYQMKPKPQS